MLQSFPHLPLFLPKEEPTPPPPPPPKGFYIYGDVGKVTYKRHFYQRNKWLFLRCLRSWLKYYCLSFNPSPFQAQERPCSWTCFTPMWKTLVKSESTSMASCWTSTKVSIILPLHALPAERWLAWLSCKFFWLLMRRRSYIYLPVCPEALLLIVYHYAYRWNYRFIQICRWVWGFCRCRCALRCAWRLCTA